MIREWRAAFEGLVAAGGRNLASVWQLGQEGR